jgi:hypothetical protein
LKSPAPNNARLETSSPGYLAHFLRGASCLKSPRPSL